MAVRFALMNRLKRILSFTELLIIVVIALIPLFPNLPYRLNSYLSWEGAYRIANGQVPFKDFGMPLGYMYWVIPAFFFQGFWRADDNACKGAGAD